MDVRYYLTAVSGMHKGRMWLIDAAGVSLGRDASCDICLIDPVVSRHQCRVVLREARVFLEDTGSRNPTLVNGAVTKNAVLRPGDTLALGYTLFLVTDASPVPSQPTSVLPDATAAWDKDSPVVLNLEEARQQVNLRPNSLADLVYLYDLTRILSRCTREAAFLKTLEAQVRERFHPKVYQIAFLFDEMNADTETDPARQAAAATGKECMTTVRGILRTGMLKKARVKQRLFTMAAPLATGDMVLGALVLQTHTPAGAYDEDDLKLLVLLASSAAPILYAAEHTDLLSRDNARLRALLGESDRLIGSSRKMSQVRTELQLAAKTGLNVLITGETGTGKELAAHMLHLLSAQRSKPFVIVNCAAIPGNLFEGELFGHSKGAFTGAIENRPGLLSLAQGGILFLDEVADLSLENQARILRVAEQGTFRPVGSGKEVHSNTRIVAATNKDLELCIAQGTFRKDLFHRLGGYRIQIPPLRTHASDIEALALHFIKQASYRSKHSVRGIAPEALEILRAHSWPGNVRELRNCILRAASVAKGDIVQARDISAVTRHADVFQEGDASTVSLADMEKHYIKMMVDRYQGNLKAAAEALGIARSTLYNKISEYNIK